MNRCLHKKIFSILAVNDLLTRSLIRYEGFDVKMKRTHSNIDEKSFILQWTVDPKRGPITQEDFINYIDTLVNYNLYQYLDLSTPVEQFLLIECDQTMGRSSSLT